MKKKKWIVWLVVAALVIAGGLFWIRFGKDLLLLIKATTTNQERLRQELEQEIRDRDSILQELDIDITLPSLDDLDDWLSGKTSPVTASPETDPPVIDPPTTEPPTTEPPVTNPPTTEPPVTNPPTTEPPVTNPPTTEPPVTNPPTTEPPVTNPPATEPPVTNPPVTNPPTTEPPVTNPPTTEPPVTNPPTTEPPVTNPPTTEPPVDSNLSPFDPPETLDPRVSRTEKEIVNECTAQLLKLETELFERLGRMKQEAIDEWTALPASERTESRKIKIGYAGLSKCYVLEAQCDKQVKDILNLYEAELKKIGKDGSVMDKLWDIYCGEKEKAKIYYLSKYLIS